MKKSFFVPVPFSRRVVSSADLLATPQARWVVDLLPYAYDLHRIYGKYFRPPEPGIYRVNGVTPVLYYDRQYFVPSCLTQPIQALAGVMEDILDDQFNVVLPKSVVARKELLLTERPTVPVRALGVLQALILTHFYKRDYGNLLGQQLTEAGIEAYREHQIDFRDQLESLYDLLTDFIGEDIYHLYEITFHEMDVYLDKLVDYRIYEWTLAQEAARSAQEVPQDEDPDLAYEQGKERAWEIQKDAEVYRR
jgi:hypothetical protein